MGVADLLPYPCELSCGVCLGVEYSFSITGGCLFFLGCFVVLPEPLNGFCSYIGDDFCCLFRASVEFTDL